MYCQVLVVQTELASLWLSCCEILETVWKRGSLLYCGYKLPRVKTSCPGPCALYRLCRNSVGQLRLRCQTITSVLGSSLELFVYSGSVSSEGVVVTADFGTLLVTPACNMCVASNSHYANSPARRPDPFTYKRGTLAV